MIITVPANEFLWSYWDVFSHHKRRYSKNELISKLERNNFIIKKISYYVCFAFPLFAVLRQFGKFFQLHKSKKKISNMLEFKTVPIINGVFLSRVYQRSYTYCRTL